MIINTIRIKNAIMLRPVFAIKLPRVMARNGRRKVYLLKYIAIKMQ
jgi:hypothetical protein